MTNYLGIDYGEAHIGLAFADGPLATPQSSIANTNGPNVLTHIATLIEKQSVARIIIGLPQGKLDEQVRAFGAKLGKMSGKEVVFHPETLSTHEAVTKLREGGAGRRKLQNDHAYAACLILEDYLETTAN